MNTPPHFAALFVQRGLPHDDRRIADFLLKYHGMAQAMRLADVPYFTPSKAHFCARP